MQSNQASPKTPILYSLTSILTRLDFGQLFPTPQPVHLELGSGDGSFLVDYAERHPELNFVGIERLLGRLRKIEKKGRRAGLRNLRAIRIESLYFLEYLAPAGSLAAIHVYFPDPWPKRKHAANRLISPRFPELASRALQADGCVYLRTDDEPYFSQMEEVFRGASGFTPMPTPAELNEVVTDFEREFNAQGKPTLSAAYSRI